MGAGSTIHADIGLALQQGSHIRGVGSSHFVHSDLVRGLRQVDIVGIAHGFADPVDATIGGNREADIIERLEAFDVAMNVMAETMENLTA